MKAIDTNWLKIIANEEKYWAKNVFTDYPTVIALEYDDLRELANNGQIQGVIDELRDIYEKIMKYPVILTLCYLEDKSKNNEHIKTVYYNTISRWISKEQSTGDWNNLLGELAKVNKKCKNELIPEPLVIILNETYKLLNKPIQPKSKEVRYANFCNWRNDVIGHGALRDVNNKNQREEIVIMLEALKKFFINRTIEQSYKNVRLYYQNELLEGVKRKAWKNTGNTINLSINDNILIDELLYISNDNERIYFFDSYSYRRNKCKYIGYKGIAKANESKMIRRLTEKVVGAVNNNTVERLIKENFAKDIYSIEASKALDDLEKAQADYIVIPEIDRWLKNKFQNERGCFEIVMDSGMGKSALSSYLKQLSEINSEKCIIRTYHFSRMKLYGIKDFISQVNLLFASIKNTIDGNDLQLLNDDVRLTDSYDLKLSKNSIAGYLNSFHEKSSYIDNKRTILILDGIDELQFNLNSDKKCISKPEFINCLPKDEDLNPGVFVLYMTRPTAKVSKSLAETIKSLPVKNDNVLVISNDMPGYIEALTKFINCGDVTKEIIRISHNSFLEAKLYIELYNATGKLKYNIESNLIGYLDILKNKYYGNGYYDIIIKKYLQYLVIFQNGLTIDELKELTYTTTELFDLIGALYDLSPILTKEREEKGTIYRLANNMYYNILQKKYYNDIIIIKKELRDYILNVGSKASFNITFDYKYIFRKEDRLYSRIILENAYDIIDDNLEDISILSYLILISVCSKYRFECKKNDIIFIHIIENFIAILSKQSEFVYEVFLAALCFEKNYLNIANVSNEQISSIDEYICSSFVKMFMDDKNSEDIACILTSIITEFEFNKWDLIIKKLDECNVLEAFSLCVLNFRDNPFFKDTWFVNLKLYIDNITLSISSSKEYYNNLNCMIINFLYQNLIYYYIHPIIGYTFVNNDCICIERSIINQLQSLKRILKIQCKTELSFSNSFLSDNLSKNEIHKIDIDEADKLFYDICSSFLQLPKKELEDKLMEFRRIIYKDYKTKYSVMLPKDFSAIFKTSYKVMKWLLYSYRDEGFKMYYKLDSKKIVVSKECYYALRRIHDLSVALKSNQLDDVKYIFDDLFCREFNKDEHFLYSFSHIIALHISKEHGFDFKKPTMEYEKLENRYIELLQYDGVSRVLDRYFIAIQLLVLSDICLDHQKAKDIIQRIDGIQTELKDYAYCGAYRDILDLLSKRMRIVYKLHFDEHYTNKKLLAKDTGSFIDRLLNIYYEKRFKKVIFTDDPIYEDFQMNDKIFHWYDIDLQMYSPYNQSWDDWALETSKNLSLIILYMNSSIRLALPEMFRSIVFNNYYFSPNITLGKYTVNHPSYIESIRKESLALHIEYINYGNFYKYFSTEV